MIPEVFLESFEVFLDRLLSLDDRIGVAQMGQAHGLL